MLKYESVIFNNTFILEDYPSLVEGIGLENRKVQKCARGFESLILRHLKFN